MNKVLASVSVDSLSPHSMGQTFAKGFQGQCAPKTFHKQKTNLGNGDVYNGIILHQIP